MQGVMNTTDGKVVRAFHRFTLVDQKSGRDIMKGRERKDGAVKISCARQDPNARNCHGYRKFVKKAVLEDPDRGFLVDDRIVIRYTIDLVVSQARPRNRLARLAPLLRVSHVLLDCPSFCSHEIAPGFLVFGIRVPCPNTPP